MSSVQVERAERIGAQALKQSALVTAVVGAGLVTAVLGVPVMVERVAVHWATPIERRLAAVALTVARHASQPEALGRRAEQRQASLEQAATAELIPPH